MLGKESRVQFFVDSRRMAYVCLPTVHDSVVALIATHNKKLGNRNIRVSFSAKVSLFVSKLACLFSSESLEYYRREARVSSALIQISFLGWALLTRLRLTLTDSDSRCSASLQQPRSEAMLMVFYGHSLRKLHDMR